MSGERFEARGPTDSGAWTIFDNKHDSKRTYFTANYPGGPQAAAEAEAARLNAWWEAEQAKKEWQRDTVVPYWILDGSARHRITCYGGRVPFDPLLAERVCRLLNEDEARTK